jgi:hypothetical protein
MTTHMVGTVAGRSQELEDADRNDLVQRIVELEGGVVEIDKLLDSARADVEKLKVVVGDVVAQAVADERAACAKVAETTADFYRACAKDHKQSKHDWDILDAAARAAFDVGYAIRARGK